MSYNIDTKLLEPTNKKLSAKTTIYWSDGNYKQNENRKMFHTKRHFESQYSFCTVVSVNIAYKTNINMLLAC